MTNAKVAVSICLLFVVAVLIVIAFPGERQHCCPEAVKSKQDARSTVMSRIKDAIMQRVLLPVACHDIRTGSASQCQQLFEMYCPIPDCRLSRNGGTADTSHLTSCKAGFTHPVKHLQANLICRKFSLQCIVNMPNSTLKTSHIPSVTGGTLANNF